MEKENFGNNASVNPTNEIAESKTIKDFCEDGNCEVKVYNDRKYIRKKKKVSNN